MKPLSWVGLVLLVLGIASLIIPIPQTHRDGVKFGGAEVGVETHTQEKVSPAISAVLIVAGAGLLAAGQMRK